MKPKALVIDDEESLRFTYEKFLVNEGYEVSSAYSYDSAMALINNDGFDVIITDIILGDKTGVDILDEVRKKNLVTPVIMITGHPTLETASDALRLGAFDYISKPVSKKTLLRAAEMALNHKQLIDENIRYRSNLEAIFRSVKDAIITVDKDFRIIEVNASSNDICGISRDSIGKPLSDFTNDCSGKCLDAIRDSIKKKESVEIYRLECHHRERPMQVVNITASPLSNKEGCVMVVRDETRLADLERDLMERRQFHNIIGGSEVMQKIYSLIEDLADVESTVLIAGESGTGKELVAEALHYKGIRSDKALVKVNCSALSESLLESELFGHVKGAFTGAVKDRQGRFQTADGGTVFLDEIGDISPKVQMQLLRVLQEKEFERVGDSTPVKVDVRVVAATNKDLRKKIKLGEFREDLFYRLKVVEIAIPPLRERREDIPLLVGHFLKKFEGKLRKGITGISPEAEEIFMEYSWPGNVRELEHSLEHACIVCRQHRIDVDDLPPELIRDLVSGEGNIDDPDIVLGVLEKTDWNIAKAARLLGVSRPTLYKRIGEIKPDRKPE